MQGVESVIVYAEEGRAGCWPANAGIWNWGYEIVVGFTAAYFKATESGPAVDTGKPHELLQARSMDGGKHWEIERPPGLGLLKSDGSQPAILTESLDFQHPDFALMFKFEDKHVGPSRFYASTDRCHSWKGPFQFAVAGVAKIAARTDYIVRGRYDCVMFASAAKPNDEEGRVFCAETKDGGLTWNLLAHIGPEPGGYIIMPSTVCLEPGIYISALRHKDADKPCSIDMYMSEDGAHDWKYLGQAASDVGGVGNPPNLLRLSDERLALVYGYRAKPYGVRARISADRGRTWGDEIVLRDDGWKPDLGYSQSVVRPDGKVVSVYYFNGPADNNRTIQATIWQP